MCGIAGFFDKTPSYVAEDVIRSMGERIESRGPDGSGIWCDSQLGINLVHRRLAILDLSNAGQQPMVSECGRYVIVFNGEIYNFVDLKSELELKLGQINWRGHSDTEIILYSFSVNGIDKTLAKIEGMFAIALWDRKESALYLIRDRMGEKPLYYGYFSNVFGFASELKSFKPHPKFSPEINRDAIGQLVLHSCIPAPLSIFKGISKLRPGHYVKLSYTDYSIRELPSEYSYWSLENHLKQDYSGTWEQSVQELEGILDKVISQQVIADVPVGCFLSGGVDSSLIASLMQKNSANSINTFSIGFTNHDYNEAQYAKEVARHLRTKHTEIYLSDKDALNVIPELPLIYDEPFSDSSQIPTYLLCKLAKADVTVSLSGDGGDELFAGYSRYLHAENIYNKQLILPQWLKRSICKILPALNSKALELPAKFLKLPLTNISDKVYKLENLLQSRSFVDFYIALTGHWLNNSNLVKETIDTSSFWVRNKSMIDDKVLMMQYFDTLGYLPDDILTKVDRAAMANSLETRVPFLNHKIVEFAFALPNNFKIRNSVSKAPLREILYKYVPKELIERPKRGFAIPIQSWLRGELKDWAMTLLDPRKLEAQGYFNVPLITKKLNDHFSGKADNGYYLWDILMYQQWLEYWKKS